MTTPYNPNWTAIQAVADTLTEPTTARAFARRRGLGLSSARTSLAIMESAGMIQRAEGAPGRAYIRKPDLIGGGASR